MSKTKWIILGVFLGLATLFAGGISCYFAGRNDERAANQQQLADAEQRWNAERVELTQALDTSQAGIDRVTSGLANAVDLAANALDRGTRIALLVDGIDRALRELGVLTDE